MNQLNLFALPPLICSIIILIAGIIVFTRNKKAEVNQMFLLLCITTTIWLSFYGINFAMVSSNPEFKENFFRITYCDIGLLSTIFQQYIASFIQLPYRRRLFVINCLYAIIISFLILKTDYIVNGLYHYYWGYYPKAGQYHPLFLTIFLSQCIATDILLYLKLKTESKNSQKYQQIKYMTFGYTIYTIACWDFIANYGVELYPFGYAPATIFILIVFYAIVKHNLMDIDLVINRSIVYSALITTITIIYLVFVVLIERISQNFFKYNSILVSVLSACVIALIFIPLRNWIQKTVDQYFFKATPTQLAAENELLRQEVVKTEKLKSIATLASGMAHEIKNPLTAIKVFSEYLPQKMDDKEFLQKFSNIVGHEVKRIDELVNDLLEFAKPSPVQAKITNMNELISETLNFLNSQLIKFNIQLTTHLNEACRAPILVDPSKIKQVFLNIFLNAIQAMPDGGRLTITTSLKSTNAGKQMVITLTDTGCGIDSKDLVKIFDPFYTTKDYGTGLGLPITHQIIKEHGGTIDVNSQIGQGTTFTIILPATPPLDNSPPSPLTN